MPAIRASSASPGSPSPASSASRLRRSWRGVMPSRPSIRRSSASSGVSSGIPRWPVRCPGRAGVPASGGTCRTGDCDKGYRSREESIWRLVASPAAAARWHGALTMLRIKPPVNIVLPAGKVRSVRSRPGAVGQGRKCRSNRSLYVRRYEDLVRDLAYSCVQAFDRSRRWVMQEVMPTARPFPPDEPLAEPVLYRNDDGKVPWKPDIIGQT
jgi:hypothetical protein